MTNKILQTLSVIFLFSFSVIAQEPCATDHVHAAMLQSNENYRNDINALEQQVQLILNKGQNRNDERSTVYSIPVVVHVIHLGEPVGTGINISDAQIQAAIDGMNNRWRNFIGNGTDMEVQFCLATVDPDGNPSTGINRVDGSAVPNYITMGANTGNASCGGANEQVIKDLSRWPVADYYNIWVVNIICGGWAGWAYYPNGNNYDGTTIRSTSMTGNSSILAHEMGHGFFLYHTFEGDNGNMSCPPDADCVLWGDHICDTQPHKQYDCGAINPCSGNGTFDNSRYNYMSYCSGLDRFTPDQKARVQATLAAPPRASLLLNTICTGPAGIEKYSKEDLISVYPVPAENQITVYGLQFTIERAAVYDMLGNSCLSYQDKDQSQTIDISALAPGIYFLKVSDTSGSNAVRKFIKM